MKVAELIALQRRCHGARRLRSNLGDGYLYLKNPYFRRVRDAAFERGFRFTTADPGNYFGFPLAALEEVLETRRIPHRDNFAALVALERRRPHFFTLRDLDANRPTPNYLLHEAAHGVAYHELFGRAGVLQTLSEPKNLVPVMSTEAFAMTAEYLAACSVADSTHRWLFGINSYRHRTQMKKPLGELAVHFGLGLVTTALFTGFLYANFLRSGIRARKIVEAIERFSDASAQVLSTTDLERLRRAVVGATRMNPGFLEDTTRLFLTRLGYSRNLQKVLDLDPLKRTSNNDAYTGSIHSMLKLLTGE